MVAQEGPPSAAARLRGGADSRRAREAALQAKCWVGGWGGHYRIIAFRLLSGPIIAISGKGSGAQISDLRRSPQVGLAAPAKTILNALSRVWISASLDATIGKHVQSRRASLVLGGTARPSNDLQCFAVRFRCWLSPSFLLSGMLLAIGCAPVVVSQLLDRYVRGTGRHRWGNDRVNSFAGRAVDRAARSWRFDRRAPAFCWQRAGTRSSRRRGMEVGAVAAVAAR